MKSQGSGIHFLIWHLTSRLFEIRNVLGCCISPLIFHFLHDPRLTFPSPSSNTHTHLPPAFTPPLPDLISQERWVTAKHGSTEMLGQVLSCSWSCVEAEKNIEMHYSWCCMSPIWYLSTHTHHHSNTYTHISVIYESIFIICSLTNRLTIIYG